MSSNGSQIKRLAKPLYDAGLSRLNISLDSLDVGGEVQTLCFMNMTGA